MRTDLCPRCETKDRLNQKKDKDGKWYGVCFRCGFEDSNRYPTRKEARYGWNRLPRKKSCFSEDELLLGTGQHWTQIPRRKRAKWFEANGIAYNPEKLVPLDPKIRRNTTSMTQPMKRAEYKAKVASGEIKKPKRK